MSWPLNFQYYREVTVTGNITNWAVEVPLDTAALIAAGKLKNTALANTQIGADVDLVVYDDTQNEIDRECSEWYNTANTALRFRSTQVGARTFRIYYGDPAFAAALANLDNIYTFWDDFPGAAIDGAKWNVGGAVNVAGSIASTTGGNLLGKVASAAGSGRVIGRVNQTDIADPNEGVFFGWSDTIDAATSAEAAVHRNYQNNPPGGTCFSKDTGVWNLQNNAPGIPNKYVYGIYDVQWQPAQILYLHDRVTVVTEANAAFISDSPMYPLVQAYWAASQWQCDWVKMMPWQAATPAVVVGAEQEVGGGAPLTPWGKKW